MRSRISHGVHRTRFLSFSGGAANLPSEEAQRTLKKYAAVASVGVLVMYLGKNSILMTDAGMTYVVQNNRTGELDVHTEPGIHRRVPFFSSVTSYRQVITASFEGKEAVNTRFADTYVGMVPVTFRFKLPLQAESVRKMHREFRSEANLIDSLLMRNGEWPRPSIHSLCPPLPSSSLGAYSLNVDYSLLALTLRSRKRHRHHSDAVHG